MPAVTLGCQKSEVRSNCWQKMAFGSEKVLALNSSSFAFVPRAVLDPYTGIYLDRAGTIQKHWNWHDLSHHTHSPPFQSITMKLNGHITIKILSQDQIDLVFTSRSNSIRFNTGSRLKVSACWASSCPPAPWNHPLKLSLGLLHRAGHRLSGGKITISFKSKFPACVNLNEIPYQESIQIRWKRCRWRVQTASLTNSFWNTFSKHLY